MAEQKRVCLVTGERGFLGTHIMKEALGQGLEPRGLGEIRLPGAEIHELVRSVNPDVVVHLAGPASVASSISDPRDDFVGTVSGTASLLEAVRLYAPRARFVYASSAAVYGAVEHLPISEDAPIRPISPYGYHKAMAEQLVEEAAKIFGLWTVTARIFSAYGVGLHRQVVYDLCVKASRGQSLILDGDGSQSRDFIHVKDVVRALLLLVERGQGRGERYNVASGVETSIGALGKLIAASFGVDAPRFSMQGRAGDPPRWRADMSRTASLGFVCEVPIEQGIGETAEWVRAQC